MASESRFVIAIEEVIMKDLRITLAIIGLVFLALGCSNEPATPDDEGTLNLDPEDEIVAGAVVARDGEIVHPRVLAALAPA